MATKFLTVRIQGVCAKAQSFPDLMFDELEFPKLQSYLNDDFQVESVSYHTTASEHFGFLFITFKLFKN